MGTQYTFTELRDLCVGVHNVIAVVKFRKSPMKTKGSGFSLFASMTDPSLDGGKFSVTFFHDNMNWLPPITSAGDVIVMHRLRVTSYLGRLRGSGYGCAGFSSAVFPGSVDAPLKPVHLVPFCSLTEEDLKRVHALKIWYNSPDCPVEKEVPMPLRIRNAENPADCPGPSVASANLQTKRLHSIEKNTFVDIEGQVVGIYTYPPEVTKDVIVYLWDGEPPSTLPDRTPFYNHLDLEQPPSVSHGSRLDPTLAAITRHSSALGNRVCKDGSNSGDWTVAVFVFDEHAASAAVANFKPGDFVRMVNLHCVARPGIDKTSVRKLDLHGGGQRYGRRIELLTNDALPPSLLAQLEAGRELRRPLARVCSPAGSNVLPLLISKMPDVLINRDDPRYFLVDNNDSPRPNARIRINAQVTGVYPATVDDLPRCILVVCRDCFVATRLSSLDAGDGFTCSCGPLQHSPSTLSICPVFSLELTDPSGRLGAFVVAKAIEILLAPLLPNYRQEMQSLLTERGRQSASKAIIAAWSHFGTTGWVDALLTVVWNPKPWKRLGKRESDRLPIETVYISECVP